MLKLMTTGDAAHALKVSITTVVEMIERGALTVAATTVKNMRLFHVSDVEELKRERTARPPRPGRRPKGEQRTFLGDLS